MNAPTSFGKWLRQRRKACDLTQDQLARQAGCSLSALRKIEADERRPSRQLADLLASCLHIQLADRPTFVRVARGELGLDRLPAPRTIGTEAPREPDIERRGSPVPPDKQDSQTGQLTPVARLEQAQLARGLILGTKLFQPPARLDRVARPRLVEKLNQVWARRLTLVAAPPGFGKTTLLSEWIPQSPHCVAWLSLDESDNDPTQFWTYLILALQTLRRELGASALAGLAASPTVPLAAVLTSLLNDLATFGECFALVLDDYQFITTPAIHESLTFLLSHLPPRAHLIIASRADPPLPLALLRARGQFAEVRADDLRFTAEEAAAFLNQEMHLELATGEVARLAERTEGWIAGLQLAALSLRGRADQAAFIAAFTGSHRFVLDYLTEQVWLRQPTDIQAFLLQTAVLDRLSASLCDAVTGRHDSQAILERLEHDNLFLVSLDDERRWYRYHHLFADALRARLEHSPLAPQTAQLHRRACDWNAQQGLVAEAVFHALRANDYDRAADLIEEWGESGVLSGRAPKVTDWLRALPEDLVRSRPRLAATYAAVLMVSNELDAGLRWLEVVEQALAASPPVSSASSLRAWVAIYRGELPLHVGDVARCAEISRAALAQLPETEPLRWPLQLRAARAYLVSGDASPAVEAEVAATIVPLQAAGNLVTLLNNITLLARLQALQGRLRAALETYAQVVKAVPPGMPILLPPYYFGLADIRREQNQLDEAEALFGRGLELMRGVFTADGDVVGLGYLSLARLKLARADRPGALSTLREFEDLARRGGFYAPWVTSAVAAQARVQLAFGNRQGATDWAAASGLAMDDDLDYPREAEYLTLARVWTAQGRPREALNLLGRWLRDAEAKNRIGSVIEILVVSALAWRAQGARAKALACLQRALALGEPETYVRLFADEGGAMAELLAEIQPRSEYVLALLAACESIPAAPVGQAEPLRPRELEVLRLIATGLSNQEIADRLILGKGTVKTHVNHLFQKLNVSSRTQAVARARALGWLRD